LKVLKWSLSIAVVSASVFSYGANLVISGKIKAEVISGPLHYLGGIPGIARLADNSRTNRESTDAGIGRSPFADQRVSAPGANGRGHVSVTTMQSVNLDNMYQPEAVTWEHSSVLPLSGAGLESSLGSIAALTKTEWLDFSTASLGMDGGNRPLIAKAIGPTDVTTVSPIPEPSTYLMMLAGFALIGVIVNRQPRAAPAAENR
jgi:hypothetical protein